MRLLQIREALRDRASSVCGLQHVLSRRAGSALAPRAPSADDRAVYGAPGLITARRRAVKKIKIDVVERAGCVVGEGLRPASFQILLAGDR